MLSCDFWRLTVIYDDLGVISDVFVKSSQEKSLWKTQNPSWAPVGIGVQTREFVSQRNHSLSLLISGIQTHSGELPSPNGCPWWILYISPSWSINSPISQRFFPVRWAARTPQISSWVITTHCRLYSNISQILLLYKTWRYYNKFDSTKSLGVHYRCENTTMRVNGAWIKIHCILRSKTYNTLHSCHNFPAGLRQAARDPCIGETSLFGVCCEYFGENWVIMRLSSMERSLHRSINKYQSHLMATQTTHIQCCAVNIVNFFPKYLTIDNP